MLRTVAQTQDGKCRRSTAIASWMGSRASRTAFPSGDLAVIHKCRQAGKHRHIGMDADIQAMDGNHPTVQVLDSGDLPTRSFPSVDSRASVVSRSLPSLDAGFRHPCRKDGPPTLVYNDESGAWERAQVTI